MIFDLEIKLPCSCCGAGEQVRVAQSIVSGDLRWYVSTNCTECGQCMEVDGLGLPPQNIRKQILDIFGSWKIMLNDVKSIPSVIKILRDHLYINTKDALLVLRMQENNGIFQGTRTEGMWLADLLRKAGEVPLLLLVT